MSKKESPRILNLPLENGRTPLGNAAKEGNEKRIKYLLDKGADPNVADLTGKTPLIIASQNKQPRIVEMLVTKGADVNAQDANGRSAIWYALYLGDLDTSVFLEKNKATASGLDCNSRTALDYAAHYIRKKNIKKCVAIAKRAGAVIVPKRKRKFVTVQSDPDFATLVYLYALSFKSRLIRLILGVWIGGLFGWVGWIAAGYFLFALPVQKERYKARKSGHEGNANLTDSKGQKNLSGANARRISGLLKSNSRDLVLQQKKTAPPIDDWLKYAHIFTLILLSSICLISVLTMYLFALVSGFWQPFNGGFLPIFLVICGSIVVLPPIHWISKSLIRKRLIAKQTSRNATMISKLQASNHIPDGEFILFLRAFSNDNKVMLGNFSFEATLNYTLSQTIDVVAIGASKKDLAPISVSSGADWESDVLRLAKKASLIVLMPASTPGVLREIQLLRQHKLLGHTVFVAPPVEKKNSAEFSETWEKIRAAPETGGLEFPGWCNSGFIFSLNGKGWLASWDALGLEVEPPPLAADPRRSKNQVNPIHSMGSVTRYYSHSSMTHVAAASSSFHGVSSHSASNLSSMGHSSRHL